MKAKVKLTYLDYIKLITNMFIGVFLNIKVVIIMYLFVISLFLSRETTITSLLSLVCSKTG